jgi:putative ABC transport system permease protein
MRARTAASENSGRLRVLAHLLRSVTWPHWADHRLRTALTVVGVSLGVSTVIGVTDVSESVLQSFRQMVRTVAGASDLEVTSVGAGVPEELVTAAARVAGVQAAAGLVEAFISLADQPDASLYVLGIDFLGSPVWQHQVPRDAIDMADELVFVARPDSVIVTQQFARRIGVELGSELRVVVPSGTRALHVRGIMRDAPVAALFDGMLAVMDLPAAQRLLDRDGRLDRIGVQLMPEALAPAVRAELAAALGPGIDVAAPETRGRQCEQLLFSLRSMLFVASSLAVIVGVFIVYQTVAVSVQQRRREFALLNTIGVRRRTLVQLCLAEIAALATAGAAVGWVGGRLLGRVASGLVGETASEIWLRLDVNHPAHSALGAMAGIAIGLVTAIASAYVAARATLSAPTVEALRPASVEIDTPAGLCRAVVTAMLLVGVTWLIVLAPSGLRFGFIVALVIVGQAVAYSAGAIIAPPLVSLAGVAALRCARRTRSLPIRLAAGNIPRSPARSGATVATIAAAIGLTVTLIGLVQSFDAAWLGWIQHHFGADLFVGSGARFRLIAGPPMGEDVAREIAAIPGVDSVEPFRVVQITLDDRPVFLEGISIGERLAHGGLAMVEGDLTAAAPALEAGAAVLLSDNLATRLGLHLGDDIDVPTPQGTRRFRVEGTFVDYLGSLDLGAVAVAQTQLMRIWGDRFANLYRVWLSPGASAAAVRRAVSGRLGNGYYVITAREFLDGVQAVLDRFFLATWALELVAALVGIIGVVNAQLATVLDRSAEIAMVRTIGVTARHVVRAVLLECGMLGALGGLCGLALGAMLGAQFVWISLRLITGWRIPFELPVLPSLATVALATFVSAAAGYVPARAAARIEARQRSVD